VIYLTLPELLHVAGRVLGPEVAVRGYGLLDGNGTARQATSGTFRRHFDSAS